MNRRYSKTIYAGTLAIGGNAPISVQSMLNAAADDIVGNVAQAIALEQAGCQMVRVAIPNKNAVALIPAIKEAVKTSPRRFIAQEVIDFKGLKVFENGRQVERKADLRAFVLYGDEIKVWHSGLTRYSQDPDSFVVNSSQGGGFKDTWVLSR